MLQRKIKTDIGLLYIVACDKFLRNISFSELQSIKQDRNNENIILNLAEVQIKEFLNKKRKIFDLPISFEGSEFQNSVWHELTNIPYGDFMSYSQLAININRPKAVRAVGSANAKNPLCIVVPCHRVISKSGALSGYIGGSDVKAKLLEIESD